MMSAPRLALALACAALACRSAPESAGPVLKDTPFVALGPADFGVHPQLGIEVGARHLLVFFRDDADDAAIRRALAAAGGELAGVDATLRYAFVRLPEGAGWPALDAARGALLADPAVESVSYDMLLEPSIIPPPRDGQLGHPSSNWLADLGWNWGLKAIGAPQAWNLIPFLFTLEPARRVQVGVVDASFTEHPDLRGVFTAHHRDDWDVEERAAESLVLEQTDPGFAHGTFVAGLIGANWNSRHSDGVVPPPFVRVHGAVERGTASIWQHYSGSFGPERMATSFGAGMSRAGDLLLREQPDIRILNISLGFNWYSRSVNGGICDPRPPVITPTSNCDPATVRAAIDASGRAFATFVRRVNAARPVLFVVAAGNDSHVLTTLPASLASPPCNAALAQGAADILVVGAHEPTVSTLEPVRAARFSDPGAHLFAPGVDVLGLTGAGGQWVARADSGTSFAAPIAAGAAAYLHLLNPRLGNADLKRLLTINTVLVKDPHAGEAAPAPVLHLGRSVAEMDVLLPGGTTVRGEVLYADLDDGSEDGFTRRGQDPGPKEYREARVDLRDLRAFRDMWWLTHPDPAVSITCAPNLRACDLNRDGAPRLNPPQEPYARAALVGRDIDLASLALLQRHWSGDARQPYTAADLPALLRSADLRIHAAGFLGRARIDGVAEATFELTGDPVAGVRPEALRDLRLTEAPAIFTTPLLRGAGLTVRAGGRTFSATIGDLEVAEDRELHLNPCAWDDPDIGLLDPVSSTCDDHDSDDLADSPLAPNQDGGDAGVWPPAIRGGSDAADAGDPHLKTWDGLFYDFQGVGEYVLVRAAGREIQARKAPLGRSVSVNAAVALRVGDDRVMIRRGERDRIWLNGQPRPLAGLALAGAALTPGPGSILVTWTGGDRLGVVIHDDSLDLYPVFGPGSTPDRAGLLGPAPDGDPHNDLVGRDGVVHRDPTARKLHRVYGDSWRVDAGESLFHYEPGEGPDTFYDPYFPASQLALADLDPDAYAAAHARCVRAGIRQPALLEACILDVASMGRSSAAWAFRGISDPKATWSPATFRADFEAGVPSQFVWAADPAAILAPPRTRAPSGMFYGPFPPAPSVDKAPMLLLSDLGSHDALAITFDVLAIGDWRGNAPGAAIVEVREAHRPIVRTTYSTGDARQAYPGSAPAGDFPAAAGALARDGLRLGGRDATFRHRVVVPHTTDIAVLTFNVHGGATERWGLDNVEVTTLRDPALRLEPIDLGDAIFQVVHGPTLAPATAGCADGSREAFLDAARDPKIAGCFATWDGSRDLSAARSGAACGEGLGACAAPADACAAGWHVCRADDLRPVDPLRCLGAGVGQFLAAASICSSEGACGPASACLAEGDCAPAICCGTYCVPAESCDDGVWHDFTWRTQDACGAVPVSPLRGVLCCADS